MKIYRGLLFAIPASLILWILIFTVVVAVNQMVK